MKPASKLKLIAASVLFLATGELFASADPDLFKPVPAGDATYVKLQTLELAGLIPDGTADKTLTRYEVADLIIKAQRNYDAIVVADANMPSSSAPPASSTVDNMMPPSTSSDDDYAAPPPPSESVMNSDSTAAVATPPPVAPTPKPTPNYALHPDLLANAEAALQSLDQTYELELQAVMQAKGIMLDDLNKAESDQYQLWRDVKSMTESPNVSIHGIGRMFGVSDNIYGPYSLTGQSVTVSHGVTTALPVIITNPETQYMNGYLDLNPTGTITKQLQWDAILRLGTSALPLTGTFQYNNGFDTANNVNYDTLNFRRISLHFSPDFMTMDLGDFYEAYTPLTLWNRNNLDLYYKPEPIARADDEYKYESFFNQEPDWPFRGLRVGTAIGWPDSNILDRFQVSGFVHMIANGFNDWPNFGWLFSTIGSAPTAGVNTFNSTAIGTNFFTDFIYAGHADLELKKWYMGDLSVQFSGHAYLVILDEVLNANNSIDYLYYPETTPGVIAPTPITEYAYNKYDPNTWAHQYRISSFAPEMKIGFGGDVYLGAQYEGSFAEYQDDKTDQARTISDFAVFANPYLQFGDSKVTFDYLNVGPNYYSPLAQTRQDYITTLSGTTTTALPGDGLYTAPLRGQYFLIDQRTLGGVPVDFVDVPRANAIYSYYDRTQDNVFPYGLATPNRQGIGFDFDLKSMPDKDFKFPGAVYFLSEISDNLVVDPAGTGFTPVDAMPNGTAPNRTFVYINLGPSFDFGPTLQLKTPLELGTNVRYEQTNSQVGTLTDFWWLTGLRVGLFKWWEVTAAAGIRTANGSDMGIDGTTLARYSYIMDNVDLGSYSVFTVNDYVSDLMLSTTFNMDSHSRLHFDYSFETGTNSGTSTSPVASGIISGAALNGTVNNQYFEVTYEVQF